MIKAIKKGVYRLEDSRKYQLGDLIKELNDRMGDLKMARICFHKTDESKLMSMLIIIKDRFHYPAHKHSWKDESYTILEGECDFVEYNKYGKETERVSLRKADYYFNNTRNFHALEPKSDIICFIEHTTGPFDGRELEYIEQLQEHK